MYDDSPLEPFYAPLLNKAVPVDTLRVFMVITEGKDRRRQTPKMITDWRGRPAKVLTTADVEQLQELVDHHGEPGRYRVEARDPSGTIHGYHDFLMEPSRGSQRRSRAQEPDEPERAAGDSRVEELLRQQLDATQTQLAGKDKLANDLQAKLLEAEQKRVQAEAQRDAAGERIGDLQGAVTELKEALGAHQTEVAQLKERAKDNELSALDALGQLDQGMDSIKGIADKFMRW